MTIIVLNFWRVEKHIAHHREQKILRARESLQTTTIFLATVASVPHSKLSFMVYGIHVRLDVKEDELHSSFLLLCFLLFL